VFFGASLIIIGIFFLLKNLGIISSDLWDVFWPSFLIIIGVKLIMGPRRWRNYWKQLSGGKKITIE
jgi:hypothetical protein